MLTPFRVKIYLNRPKVITSNQFLSSSISRTRFGELFGAKDTRINSDNKLPKGVSEI